MSSDKNEATVDVNYIKSAQFREVSADGVMGGPTPEGKIWLAFYTERFALPQIMRHRVTEGGNGLTISDEGEQIQGRNGIVRNVEFGLYLSVEEARGLAEWINTTLREIEEGANE